MLAEAIDKLEEMQDRKTLTFARVAQAAEKSFSKFVTDWFSKK